MAGVGEPTPGADGYTEPSLTPANLIGSVGIEVTVTINQTVTLRAFDADLETMGAIYLHYATGKCPAAGPITALVFNSGATRSIAAGAITITLA